MSDFALQHLINILSTENAVSANAIRNSLKEILPDRVTISATDCHNLRLRAKLIINEAKAIGRDPTSLIKKSDIPYLTKSLDNETSDYMDKAVKEADNIFTSLLSTTELSSRIYNFLYQLSIADPGFTFKFFQ